MDIQLFDKLMEHGPDQHPPEWRMFLEICEMYLKKHGIENPIVVELGVSKNNQKKFYEQLLGAEHIGIDRFATRGIPDILGDLYSPETMKALRERLGGRPINILFIDALHDYNSVKKDFEMYSPLCSDIVALHDVENCRNENDTRRMVWKFWDELKGVGKNEVFMSLLIHQYKDTGNRRQMGIGMMIKS